MIRAYNELYLNDARRTLAGSFDHAVYTYGYTLPEYFGLFVDSKASSKFEKGDPFIISGMSGIELARSVIGDAKGKDPLDEPVYHDDRTPEYWVGWSLAYYQWYSGCSFKSIKKELSIETMLDMYDKYHEMDIMKFIDRLNTMRAQGRMSTYLKTYRERMGYSQKELAELTGIPVRTLQQYEQGQKSINRARADYVINLAGVLNIEPNMLMEIEA